MENNNIKILNSDEVFDLIDGVENGEITIVPGKWNKSDRNSLGKLIKERKKKLKLRYFINRLKGNFDNIRFKLKKKYIRNKR